MLENVSYAAEDQAGARRVPGPYAVLSLWIAGTALAGAALQLALPDMTPAMHGRVGAFFGAFAALASALYSLSALPGAKAFQDKSCAAVLLTVLAVLTALGTLVVAPGLPTILAIHRSFYMSGLLGLLAGMQLCAILSRRAWQGAGIGRVMLVAHGGILLILAGAGLDTAFGSRGFINLHEGGESRIYSETSGLSNALTGHTGVLRETVRLNSIETEYHDRDVYLRLYRDGALAKSWPVTEGLKGSMAGRRFRVAEYLPDASLSRNVTALTAPTGKAAIKVGIETGEVSTADWLFAEAGNYGFIKRPDGTILVRLFLKSDPPPAETDGPELQIDASAGRWRVTGGREGWKPLPEQLDVTVDGIKIQAKDFIRNAKVEDKVENRSEKPGTPVIQLQIEEKDGTRGVFLSPLLPVPVKLDERHVIVTALADPQPSMFTSKVTTIAPDGSEADHVIRVNHPLSVGFCKVYQSDFDPEDPAYSGFSVNCAPGTWIVKTGMALMILGLLGSVFYGARFAVAGQTPGKAASGMTSGGISP